MSSFVYYVCVYFCFNVKHFHPDGRLFLSGKYQFLSQESETSR